jgi:hypothetical protein
MLLRTVGIEPAIAINFVSVDRPIVTSPKKMSEAI